jgi:hypothetical protein
MTRHQQEQQIAADLNLIAMIEFAGDRNAKRAAKAQRKAIQAQIKAWNVEDGIADMTDEEILAELMA